MSKIRRNWFPLTIALCVLACLICIGYVFAQVSPQIQGAGAPSNPCNNGGQQYVDQTNHVIYSCPSSGGNWVNIQLGQATGTGFSNNGVNLTSSLPLLVPDGTGSAPAYSFSGQPALGIFRQSNSLGFGLVNSSFTMGGSSSIIDMSFLSGSFRFYGNGNSGQIVMRSPLQLGDGSTGGQITQNAASTTGGTCTMSTTTCTITLAVHYASGLCTANTSGASAIASACSVSTATPSVITITAASSNTQAWSALAWGNPN